MDQVAKTKEVKWNDEINIRVPAWALYVLPLVALYKNGADWAIGILFLWLVSSGQLNAQAKWGKSQWRKFWIITLSVVVFFIAVLAYVILRNEVLMTELWQHLQR